MVEIQKYNSIFNVPDAWNALTENYFQKLSFLKHAEKHNVCNQRYFVCFQDNRPIACAVMYSLRLDLLTYLRVKSPIKMNIIGIPCSVSCPGIFGDKMGIQTLKEYLYTHEKGFILVLNLFTLSDNSKIARGKTLPSIILKNSFLNWEHYLKSLRSHYRRRLLKILKIKEQLVLKKMPLSYFNDILYQQYLDVYKRSNDKLEKLTMSFFKNLPDEFVLTVCFLDDVEVGWNLAVMDNSIYYFFMGGIDYSFNKEYNTYFILLAELIKEAIEKSATYIDLGQTAEVPKMRLGGEVSLRYMEAKHSNTLLNSLFRFLSPYLAYKRKNEQTKAIIHIT